MLRKKSFFALIEILKFVLNLLNKKKNYFLTHILNDSIRAKNDS